MIGNASDAKLIRDYDIASKYNPHNEYLAPYCCEECESVIERHNPDWDRAAREAEIAAARLVRPRRPLIPEGWTRVGSGAYRTAYLSPGGVIYKVEHNYATGAGWGQSNRGEYENILRMVRENARHEFCRLPKSTYFQLDGRGVMAMEYINGERPEMWECGYSCSCAKLTGECNTPVIDEIGHAFGIDDMHAGNIAWLPAQRTYVLLDCGA